MLDFHIFEILFFYWVVSICKGTKKKCIYVSYCIIKNIKKRVTSIKSLPQCKIVNKETKINKAKIRRNAREKKKSLVIYFYLCYYYIVLFFSVNFKCF